ncbi:MAG: DUF5689 domain-containing protein [Bacteroidales bacterium]
MRLLNKLPMFLIAVLAAANFSCTKDYVTPNLNDQDPPAPTHTIEQLKSQFLKGTDNFSATDLIDSETPVYITGIVVSDDRSGNIYKSLMIQEENPTNGAIAISIDAGSLTGLYPVGQKVTFRCDGLNIGRYGGMPQIGVSFFNASANRTDLGRLPMPIAKERIKATGLPVKDKAIIADVTIPEVTASGVTMLGKLIRLQGVTFEKGGDQTFGVAGTNVKTQYIVDEAGNKIFIGTSQYADFAETTLPTGRGDMVLVVSKYNNTWQLILRSLRDLGEGFIFE